MKSDLNPFIPINDFHTEVIFLSYAYYGYLNTFD